MIPNSLKNRLVLASLIAALFTMGLCGLARAQSAATVSITLDKKAANKPVTGRMLVFFSKSMPQPMFGPNWFGPEPFFGLDVKDVQPGGEVVLDDSADYYKAPLSKIKDGTYNVQAILDHDFFYAEASNGPGNFYCAPMKVEIKSGRPTAPIKLNLDQVVKDKNYKDTELMKFVEIESTLLSEFHKRPVTERAMVVLPPSYATETGKRYPVYVVITGFGGTYERIQQRHRGGTPPAGEGEAEFIRVYLTGQCKWGHHVYANSATNGPRGDMLVKELIPQIDKQFRTIAEPTARFVGGHSSGGWSSLWLQVTYPEFFGGVWSTAPDPVDFRDWQGTNIYEKNANVFTDPEGKRRPLARRGSQIMAYYDAFTQMDDVLGRGGQIRSFDGVFSPLDENGLPKKCWDRNSGNVDPDIVDYWKQYDISLNLKNNWSDLGPKLKTKLHVYMGAVDTFYLEGATVLLGKRLKELGSDAIIEIFPGKDHMNLLDGKLRSRIMREMSQQFWKSHPKK
ncbi:MAG: alpha/beta hydrolase-fold protein [Mariniblastus sp.]